MYLHSNHDSWAAYSLSVSAEKVPFFFLFSNAHEDSLLGYIILSENLNVYYF